LLKRIPELSHNVASITTDHTVGINFMVVQLNLIACGNIIYEDIIHKIPTI